MVEEERDRRTKIESSLRDAEFKLSDAEFKLSDAENKLRDVESQTSDAAEKLRDAETKLVAAEARLADLEMHCQILSIEKTRFIDRIDTLEEGNERFFEIKEKQVSFIVHILKTLFSK